MIMPAITILTPTFNRCDLISKVYNSLCIQTCKDFEWIIVDDGSKDNTSDIVERFIEDKVLSILYQKKENGGKHTALNVGIRAAKGELVLILDSDDDLPPDAVETIKKKWDSVSVETGNIGGLCFYMAYRNGKVIGTPAYNDIDASSIEMRYRLGLSGDMCEIFRTQVLREFPFPEFPQEKFCPEQLVWFRIAQRYKLRMYSDIVYYREYLPGGLTDKIIKIRMESPRASCMTYAEMLKYDIPFRQKIRAAINYWRFRYCINSNVKERMLPQQSLWWIIIAPIGFLMHLQDIRKVRKS